MAWREVDGPGIMVPNLGNNPMPDQGTSRVDSAEDHGKTAPPPCISRVPRSEKQSTRNSKNRKAKVQTNCIKSNRDFSYTKWIAYINQNTAVEPCISKVPAAKGSLHWQFKPVQPQVNPCQPRRHTHLPTAHCQKKTYQRN